MGRHLISVGKVTLRDGRVDELIVEGHVPGAQFTISLLPSILYTVLTACSKVQTYQLTISLLPQNISLQLYCSVSAVQHIEYIHCRDCTSLTTKRYPKDKVFKTSLLIMRESTVGATHKIQVFCIEPLAQKLSTAES